MKPALIAVSGAWIQSPEQRSVRTDAVVLRICQKQVTLEL